MPQVLGNTTVGDAYPSTNQSGGAVLGYSNDVFQQGYVFIANNAVFLKYLRGLQGTMQESAELYLAPGYYPLIGGTSTGIGFIGGFKMRNAVAGSAAQAAGALFYPGEAQLGTGQPFSGTVSPSGGVTPGPGGGVTILARKTTSKQVVNSTAATDLLNGEVTIAAAAMGSTGMLRLTAFGDWKQNSGASTSSPRLQLLLGGTTLLDTNAPANTPVGNSASRFGWSLVAEILNLGAPNSQWSTIAGQFSDLSSTSTKVGSAFSTGEGSIVGLGDTGGTNQGLVPFVGGAASAVNTSVANALVLNVINPALSANVDTTLTGAIVELL